MFFQLFIVHLLFSSKDFPCAALGVFAKLIAKMKKITYKKRTTNLENQQVLLVHFHLTVTSNRLVHVWYLTMYVQILVCITSINLTRTS
jgi:hypothetical protein